MQANMGRSRLGRCFFSHDYCIAVQKFRVAILAYLTSLWVFATSPTICLVVTSPSMPCESLVMALVVSTSRCFWYIPALVTQL